MKFFKSHFAYNKRERNGIFYLLIIIVLLQGVYFFVDFSPNEKIAVDSPELAQFNKEFDSLQKIALEAKKPKIFPFNPNYLSDFKAYQLGMSVAEIDRLIEFRNSGKYVNSSSDFQKVTEVSDSLLKAIQPLFKFPKTTKNYSNTNSFAKKIEISKPLKNLKDLNKATIKDLKEVKGVGEKLAERIVKYKNTIKGYYFTDQLFEVYGLNDETIQQILFHFEIKDKPKIHKINVNTSTFKEVLALPYIDYELTKRIFNYKNEVVEIQSIEELKKIDGFPVEKFSRIALYLEAN